jgi:hypothetical protein
MKAAFLAALLGILGVVGLGASAYAFDPAGLGHMFPRACAAGYYPDEGNNCQPASAQVSRQCAPGLVYQPFPDGWRCVVQTQTGY